MRGREPHPLDAHHAARRRRKWQLEPLLCPWREIRAHQRKVRERGLEANPGCCAAVTEGKLQRAGAARKHGRGDGSLHLSAKEIPVTLLHDHQCESGQQEGEKQRQAVGVVEPCQQHEEEQRGEGHPAARWQNIEPPTRERHRQLIESLAAAHPLARPYIERRREGGERVPPCALAGCRCAHAATAVPGPRE